jgi:hypothetical protein
VVLASIARAVRLEIVEQEEPVMPVHRVTLRPDRGLPMRISGREAG